MNSFKVLLTKSVGMYVARSARDYPDYTACWLHLTVHRGMRGCLQ